MAIRGRKDRARANRGLINHSAKSLPDEVAVTLKALYPDWMSVSGAYSAGDIVRYGNELYRCVQPHTSQGAWNPADAASLWVKIADPANEFPEWEQKQGAHDAYKIGDKVSFGGKKWVSTYENNTYAPGVYGWEEVS